MKTGFFGQSYTTQSPDQACNELINLYPELSEEAANTKSVGAFYACPGFRVYCNTAITGEVREMYQSSDGQGFAVVKDKLIKLIGGIKTDVGTLSSSSGGVSIVDNGLQLCIVDGTAGYLVDLSTLAFSAITDEDFPNGCTQVAYQDTYFIVFDPASQQFRISGQNDGSTWDSLDFGSAEGAPDDIVALISDHRELVLFGDKSVEVFTNSGNADFPFERFQGAYIEHGCVAPFSVAKLDNSVFWLGGDDKGQGLVWKMNGYQPQRVSTFAVEYDLRTYSDISDARAITYQEDGHTFYMLVFPTQGTCWVYDAAVNLWHKRAHFSEGAFTRWRGNCHMFHEGKHLIGDYENGIIYEMSLDVYDYSGAPRKWLRRWRVPNNENKNIFYYSLTIDAQGGVGLDGSGQGTAPVMMLRISNDGGHTFANERRVSMGAIGAYRNRATFRRLGRSENRVYEISGTDPTIAVLINAYQEAVAGSV